MSSCTTDDVAASERLAVRLGRLSLRRSPRRPDAAAVGESIRVAARLPLVRVSCLPRTLTAITMLSRRGLRPEMHVGVSGGDGPFAAHAWATVDGVDVVSEPDDVGAFVELLGGAPGTGMFEPAGRRDVRRSPMTTWSHDLFWWRNADGWHTVVALWGGWLRPGIAPVAVDCRVRDAAGVVVDAWRQTLDPRWGAIIRSDDHPAELEGAGILDGVLEVVVDGDCLAGVPPTSRGSLYGLVDWYHDDGSLAGLHSDHVPGDHRSIELTEIVVEADDVATASLVTTAGPKGIAPGGLGITVTNVLGETRHGCDPASVAPWGVHHLRLAEIVQGLDGFADGQPLTVSGVWELGGHFVRPYVVTESTGFSAYHGGNRYPRMRAMPSVAHRIHGRGDLNPIAVVHGNGVTTTFDLFNTHGSVESAPWVDVRVYDDRGRLVHERLRWRRAERDRIARGAIGEFLDDPSRPFVGHLVLSFADDGQAEFPLRLQALFRYVGPVNHARTMVWSDDWNSPVRRHQLGDTRMCAYTRAWLGPRRVTSLLFSNAGIPGVRGVYDLTATFRLVATSAQGEVLAEVDGEIGPHATVELDMAALCAGSGGNDLALVEVTTNFDLAMIQITRDRRSGAIGVEHLLAGRSIVDGSTYVMAGS